MVERWGVAQRGGFREGVGPGVGGDPSNVQAARGLGGPPPCDGGGSAASAGPASPGHPRVRSAAGRREPAGGRPVPFGLVPDTDAAQRHAEATAGQVFASPGPCGPSGGAGSWASPASAPASQGAAGVGPPSGAAMSARAEPLKGEGRGCGQAGVAQEFGGTGDGGGLGGGRGDRGPTLEEAGRGLGGPPPGQGGPCPAVGRRSWLEPPGGRSAEPVSRC